MGLPLRLALTVLAKFRTAHRFKRLTGICLCLALDLNGLGASTRCVSSFSCW